MDSIGERIKFLRKKNSLTIQELAGVIQKSKSNISGYESGAFEPSAQTIIKICDYFSISSDWLLFGKESSGVVLTDKEAHLIELYDQLPAHDQNEITEIMKIKLASHPKGRSYLSKTGKSDAGTGNSSSGIA